MHSTGIFVIFENKSDVKMKKIYLITAVLALFAGKIPAQDLVMPSGVPDGQSDSLRSETVSGHDSLSVPLVAPVPHLGMTPFSMYGMSPYGYMDWGLHKGFNASLGMSVTFSPGQWAPSGVGFGQNAAFMYAVPITDRLSVAAGIYASHFDWGFVNYKNVGFAGVAAFKVNDRISVYAYGNKSFMPKRSLSYYPLPNFAPDRVGGMVNFKLGESSSISFGVEGIRYPDGCYWR